MKKSLLIALCAGAALAANAGEDRVIFDDDFEWLQPICDSNPDIIDNIAEDNATANTPQLIAVTNSEGTYARSIAWERGYWFLGLNGSDGSDDNPGWCGTQAVYMGKNFLKFGKENIQARIKLNQTRDILTKDKLTDDEYLVIEFDWTPWKDADGKYDEVTLDVDIFNEANEWVEHDVVAKVAENTIADGQPFQWQHVEVDLSDFDINGTHSFSIKSSEEYYGIRKTETVQGVGVPGVHRWAIDNIKITAKTFGGVHNVEIDANAPKEYFNLQGVRVENPSNGIYIMRQGTKTTKVRF